MSVLVLSGIVSSDDDLDIYNWYGLTAFCPAMLRKAIAETENGDTLTIELNSPGGNAFAGVEMHSVLADAPCSTHVVVQSYAASAASVLALGADTVQSTPGAQFMLHLPSVYADGNATAHQQALQMLESTTDAILNIYFERCKGNATREELRAIMEAETWLPTQRCIELGLIDGIHNPKERSNADIVAAFGLPDIATLRARYTEAKVAECTPPPNDHQPNHNTCPNTWKAQAAINIEKNRF